MIKENYKKFNKIGDIIWYDGPLMSLFEFEDKHYIFSWFDNTDIVNKWAAYQVPLSFLDKYLDNKISERTLIDNRIGDMSIVEIDSEINLIHEELITEIPDDIISDAFVGELLEDSPLIPYVKNIVRIEKLNNII